MVISGKIEAIKLIREAASNAEVVKNLETGRHEIRCGIGLLQAKQLYEAIEAYVVRRFVEDLAHTSQVARGLLVQIESQHTDPHPHQ